MTKKERKEKLIEIYNILAKIKGSSVDADLARKKVTELLSHDGYFIFEKGE